MRRIAMLSAAVLLMAGVAVAGEDVTQSEKNVQEKTTHSTTVRENAGPIGETRHKSTTVEKQRQTTTSDDMDADTTTREKVEVEKNRSKTVTGTEDQDLPGSTQQYHQQSETYHQHTSKEVEKK